MHARSLVAENKARLRKAVLARRKAIPAEKRAERSAELCDRVFDYLIEQGFSEDGRHLSVYAPLESEIDVIPLVRRAEEEGWAISFPVMIKTGSGSDARMQFVTFDGPYDEADDREFLHHPVKALTEDDPQLDGWRFVEPEKLGVVIVPMVAFDLENNRLGYGGGNYDRLFEQLAEDALKLGVAFEEQKVAEIPTETHDFKLDRIFVA